MKEEFSINEKDNLSQMGRVKKERPACAVPSRTNKNTPCVPSLPLSTQCGAHWNFGLRFFVHVY